MRKVQDYYFKQAKKENYPARSVYKLEEAQRKYGFLKPGQRVLELGCHPGSWSLYAAGILGEKGTLVAVDLQDTVLAPQKLHAEIHWLCYDVSSQGFAECLKKRWPGFHVLLSDMAPRTTGSPFADHQHSLALARRVLELAVLFLHDKGVLYCKVFQGEDFPGFLRETQALFQTVKVIKPRSSRQESREVFVLAQGFCRRG